MSLSRLTLLFVDCQTTGMRPPSARLLELAWSVAKPGDLEPPVQAHLIRLEGARLPSRVSRITGLSEEDLAGGAEFETAARLFAADAATADLAVIHYAQFEKPFLLDLYRRILEKTELPFPVLCTHQLCKRLFPALPSQNIRAAAGYFGAPVLAGNRAGVHVRATQQIWRGIATELDRLDLTTPDAVQLWLKETPKGKPARYEYRLNRLKRLQLPDEPGVYRMLGQTGEVLYVGKATSLRSRVNSYFRGRKGRDKFKLEMLAQTWDIRVTSCPSALEAALLESDEIKRFDPPYNIVLKSARRHLLFYNRDFTAVAKAQSPEFIRGPYKNQNWIESLRALSRSTASERFEQIFWNPLPEDDLRAGFSLFLEQQRLEPRSAFSVRTLLALGLTLYRRLGEPEDKPVPGESADAGKTEESVVSAGEIAGKYERLLRRAGAESRRVRHLTRLLNATVSIGGRRLEFIRGQLEPLSAPACDARLPWEGLELETYDRMSILLSELQKTAPRSAHR